MATEFNIEARIRHDQFAAIAYETRKNSRGTVVGIQLGAHFVFKWLVKDVWERACKSVITASQCKFYTTEDLFNDPEYWVELEKQYHIAAGRCVAHFESRKMLPLHCVNPSARNKKYMVTFI